MPIDFTPTPAQHELQREARRFARRVLAHVDPALRGLATPEQRFAATRPFYEELVREGWLRRLIPVPFGGDATGLLDVALITEEFHAVNASVSLTALATVLGLTPLMVAGTAAQQQAFFAPFLTAQGAPLAAFAFSEPGGSANFTAPAPAEGVRTRARRDGAEWVISGAKQWVSSASGWDGRGADLVCTVCRAEDAGAPEGALCVVAVPRPTRGFVLEQAFDTLGHKGHLTPRFRFDDVRVPAANLIGAVGAGPAIVEHSFAGTAAVVGMMSVALMRAAFGYALDFARRERRAGAVPILAHQAVGYALADAKAAIEAVRALSLRACQAQDAQSPTALELSLQAKVFGSETAVRVVTELMRVVGIESYNLDAPLAGLLQDAVALPLFDGGNLGVRRRQLHTLMLDPAYDPLATAMLPSA